MRLAQSVLLSFLISSSHAQITHGTIEVTQTAVEGNPATMTFTGGSSADVDLETPFNRGDYGLDLPNNNATQGVLITNPAEHSRSHPGEAEFQATTSSDITPSNTYSIALHKTPSGSEGNLNCSFVWLSYDDWYGAHATGPNNGETDSINGHSAIELGTHFIDESVPAGVFTVDLQSIDSTFTSANGILLANGGENEDNFAISQANSDGTFTIYNHDNGIDGSTYEQERVSFVYLPKSELGTDGLYSLGRVKKNATFDVSAGPAEVTKGSTGEWFLTIPGHNPSTGTLIVTPAAGPSGGFGNDNFVTSEWDDLNQRWSIKSWDLKGSDNPAVAQDSISDSESQFNFAFFTSNLVRSTDGFGPESLSDILSKAREGSTITFDPALSGKTINYYGNQLDLTKDVIIDASNLPRGITIDANQLSRVIRISPGANVTLQGLTLTGGKFSGFGGGILNNGTLTLKACTLTGNTASNGGGLANLGFKTSQIIDSTFSQNVATFSGGAIFAQGEVNLKNTTVSDNCADLSGGGLLVESFTALPPDDGTARVTLENSLVAKNHAPSDPDITRLDGPTITLAGTNLIGDNTGSGLAPVSGLIGTNAAPVDPLLAPFGYYGGPTQTLHPNANSPAILPGANTTRTDQRGFTFTGPPTIGAVKPGSITIVDTLADESDGDLSAGDLSLREAISANATIGGAIIRFAPALDGETITLTQGQLLFPSQADGLFIDASTLSNGLTIDANGSVTDHRVLEIQSHSAIALHTLTLTGGKTANGSNGGGILVNPNSSLTLIACTVSNNQTGDGGFQGDGGFGGGIFVGSDSFVTLTACTVSNNRTGNGGDGGFSGGDGGGGGGITVGSNSILTLTASTVCNNRTGNGGDGEEVDGSSGSGGGIFYAGSKMDILHCTIVDNIASGGASGGGIIYFNPGVTITASIIAQNEGRFGDDIYQRFSLTGSVTTDAESYIGDLSEWAYTTAPTTGGDINLAPLGHYGGPTMTMPPLPGSPAIDAGAGSTHIATDQRGLPRLAGGALDIGAVEIQSTTDHKSILAPLWDTDLDGDGSPFGIEFALGTDWETSDPEHPANKFVTPFGSSSRIQFGRNPDALDFVNYILKRTTDLADYEEMFYYSISDTRITGATAGFDATGTLIFVWELSSQSEPNLFYRFEAELRE